MSKPLLSSVLLTAVLLLSACASGEPTAPGQATAVSTVAPAPEPPTTPIDLEAAHTEFGGLLRLEAARLLTPTARPGDRVGIALRWRLLAPRGGVLEVVARLVDEAGRTRARHDLGLSRAPADGVQSSGDAARGALVNQEFDLQLSTSIEPGRYALTLAVHDAAGSVAIPISGEDGLPPVVVDYEQTLGEVWVASTSS